jgi:hypothetical protein
MRLQSFNWVMPEGADDDGSVPETAALLERFEGLKDSRQRAEGIDPLNEIPRGALRATRAGAETLCGISEFGQEKLALLREFLPLEHGVPTPDRLGEDFGALDCEQFQKGFVVGASSPVGIPEGLIAIDSETSGRCHIKKRGFNFIPIVSAFAARQRLVRG